MGLFDSLAGSMLGKLGGERGTMVQIAMDLLNKHGGVSGVLAMFKAKGYTEQVNSWVGNGQNLPISAEQVAGVLGQGELAQMAAKFGITPDSLSSKIAEHLPTVVDRLTPNGVVDDSTGNLLSTVMGMFK
jgi:uncharacterized protein YidB (DUF937 family)